MQSQVYRTKVSPYVLIPVALVMAGMVAYLLNSKSWVDVTVVIPIFAFFIHLYYSTAYTITGTELHVKSGFLVDDTIDIYKIKAISETHTILSAPALSLDRIEIFYNTYDSIIISPPNKHQFIAALRAINPNIEVKLKEKIA